MFLWIGFIMAIIITAVCTYLFPIGFIFIPLIFVSSFVSSLAFLIAILFLISLFYPQNVELKKDDAFCRFLAYHTMEAILAVFRFRVQGEGLSSIPKEPFVLVCNHLSRFDPMVSTLLMKTRQLAFISKKENMKLPIVGNITYRTGFLALDRENPLRAMRTIHKAAKYVSEKGYVMGIYPEGTRSKTGELLEFKTGAFVMAKKAKAPIAVCAIYGTDRYKKRFPFRSTEVTLRLLAVISSQEVEKSSPEELSRCCRELILADQKGI